MHICVSVVPRITIKKRKPYNKDEYCKKVLIPVNRANEDHYFIKIHNPEFECKISSNSITIHIENLGNFGI